MAPAFLLGVLPCVVAGLALAIVGWRGRPRWSHPTCARCGYDLRGRTAESSPNCPECGAPLADKPEAVRFARGSRHRGILVLALVVFLLPFLEVGGIEAYRYVEARHNPPPVKLPQQPTSVVLQMLATQINTPWVWNELDARLGRGKLTPADVGAAVEQLITFLQSQPGGYDQPLHWSRRFLDNASQARMIASEQMVRLAEALHGTAPQIRPLRLRVGNTMASVYVTIANIWGVHSLPVRLYNELREIRLDGQPISLGQTQNAVQWLSATLEGPFTLGTHTLEVEVESALIDKRDTVGLREDAPSKEWPAALRRWRRTGTMSFTVYADEAQLVELVTDPALDPMRNGGISVTSIVVRPDDAGSRVIVQLRVNDDVSVPLSFDVQLRIAGQLADAGNCFRFGSGQSSRFSGPDASRLVPKVPESVKEADVILKPNPRHVDPYPEVTRIWGKEIVIEKVPLRRYDTATQPANDK